MNARRKIAHIVFRCVPGDYRGGVEKMVLELAKAQAAAGHAVDILAVRTADESDVVEDGGVSIRYFAARRVAGNVWSPAMADFVRTEPKRYDVLHIHNVFHLLNAQMRRIAHDLSWPLFVHAHGALDPKLLRGTGLRALKKKLYIAAVERPNFNRANAVFALSAEERDQLLALGIVAPIEIVPNGIAPPPARDPAAGLTLRAQLGIAPGDPLILYLGRIVGKKGLDDVIEALALVRNRHPRVTLALAGNPVEEPAYGARLKEMIAARGFEANVHWLGFLDETRKADAYSAADMFIHASHSEGMAMAILEAMAAGLPTLVTRGCYMGEAAAAGAVIEVAGGAGPVADGLVRLIEDSGARERIAATGRSYAETRHGWPALAERVLAAYGRHSGARAG